MNPDFPQNEREKLERKLMALLLGELPAHEEASLHRAMDEDPELAGLYERLKVTIELVRSAECGVQSAESGESGERGVQSAELKLPPEKRKKLLAHFKTVRPKEFAEAPSKRVLFDNRRNRLLEWAAVAAVAIILAAITVPNFVRSRSTSTKNTVLNNLRLLDGAKQTWALEANASVNAIPSPAQVAPYFGRGGTVETDFSPIAMPGVKYVVGKVGETPGIQTSASQARRWMGGQRIPQDRVHNGQVQLSMGELMDQKFDQNPAPQVAMNSPWQTRFVRNITKSGPNEQSDSTLGLTQRGNVESRIAGQEASVSREVIRAKGGEERQPSAQPLIPREVDDTATFGFNTQPPPAPPKPEIFLPSGNEASGKDQLAMNNADFGKLKSDNVSSSAFSFNDVTVTNGVAGQPGWIGVLETPEQSRSAENRAVGRYAYVVSGVTNYTASDLFDDKSAGAGGIGNLLGELGSTNDSYNPQTYYRMLSQSDSGGGQTNLEINYTNLIAGTVRRAEAEIRADEAERLRQANRELELSESKTPTLGDIPSMGAVFQGELGPIETNGQVYTGLTRDDVSGLRYLPTNGVVASQPIDGNGGTTMNWNTFDGTTNSVATRYYNNPGSAIVLADNAAGTPVAGQTPIGGTLADNSQTAENQNIERSRRANYLNGHALPGPVEAPAAPPAPQPTPKTVIALPFEPSTGVPLAGEVAGGDVNLAARLPRRASGGKQVEIAAVANQEARSKARPQMTPIANKPPDEAANGTEVASAPTAPNQPTPVATMPEATLREEMVLHHRGEDQAAQEIQDGKVLLQSGKLDEANAKLKEALARDPNNQAALYYESLIKQISTNGVVAMGGSQPAPVSTNVFAANVVGYTASAEAEKRVELADAYAESTRPPPLMTTKTLDELKSRKIQMQADYEQQSNLLTTLKSLNRKDLKKALPVAVTDNQLDTLLRQRDHEEQNLIKLKADHADGGPKYQSAESQVNELNRKVNDRIEEVVVGLQTKVDSTKAQLDSIKGTIKEAQKKDVELAQLSAPYYQAKEKLEAEKHLRDVLSTQVTNQSDTALPKPAVPPPTPQPEILTRENAFSTFSMNVSDVSFKLAAASLEKGQMPEAASIRSEEFINAFDYRDPEAAPGVPVAFNYERALYPFAHNRELLRFSLKTAAAGRQAGRPLNIVLLLDNSGSMERADRVRIIQEALGVLAGQLQAQDTFSIVTFARTPRLRVDGIPGNQAAAAATEVGKFTPEGGTDLGDALDVAYETALHHYLANGDNRVVLLTDGAANLGDVDSNSLKQKVETHRKQGIALDCFGIGWEGYNDDLLEVLTRDGDGRYGFINTPEEASTGFVSQIAGALHVAAADVKVQVEFNPDRVNSYRQIGYAKHQLTKEQFRDNTVAAGQIAAQEAGNALYTIEVNPQGQGSIGTVRVRYKVPDTGEIREQSWDVPYTGTAVPLEQASPAMRLATTASAFSEWLATSPFAEEVTTDQLLNYLNGVPQVYGADTRPQKLEWMIRQAKSISGK